MNSIGKFKMIALALVSGIIGGATSSLLSARIAAGSRDDRVVTAEEFRVVDGSGRIRAKLAVLPFGAGLAIYSRDKAGHRTWLGDSGLSITGEGQSTILMGVSENSLLSDASLSLTGRDGKSRISMSANSGQDALGGGARLRLGREVSAISIGCPHEGRPSLEVQDGKVVRALQATKPTSVIHVAAQVPTKAPPRMDANSRKRSASSMIARRTEVPVRASRRNSRISETRVAVAPAIVPEGARLAVASSRDGGGSIVDRDHTCVGGVPCTACRNCKYCKHCGKNGGKCGFCKG